MVHMSGFERDCQWQSPPLLCDLGSRVAQQGRIPPSPPECIDLSQVGQFILLTVDLSPRTTAEPVCAEGSVERGRAQEFILSTLQRRSTKCAIPPSPPMKGESFWARFSLYVVEDSNGIARGIRRSFANWFDKRESLAIDLRSPGFYRGIYATYQSNAAG